MINRPGRISGSNGLKKYLNDQESTLTIGIDYKKDLDNLRKEYQDAPNTTKQIKLLRYVFQNLKTSRPRCQMKLFVS